MLFSKIIFALLILIKINLLLEFLVSGFMFNSMLQNRLVGRGLHFTNIYNLALFLINMRSTIILIKIN